MQKRMIAKFAGKDARTGAPIRKGDEIIFDTATRQAWHTDEDDDRLSFTTTTPPNIRADYVSHVFNFGNGREYYRNKAGRYERATPAQLRAILKGRKLRIGTYGDGAAAPVELWE